MGKKIRENVDGGGRLVLGGHAVFDNGKGEPCPNDRADENQPELSPDHSCQLQQVEFNFIGLVFIHPIVHSRSPSSSTAYSGILPALRGRLGAPNTPLAARAQRYSHTLLITFNDIIFLCICQAE